MIVGPWRARRLLIARLQQRAPAKITALRAEIDTDLPDIGEWHAKWVPREHLNSWPAVMATALRSENQGRIDWIDGNPVHRFDWTIRIFVWTRGEGYDETAARAELYAVALADTLLADPGLAEGITVQETPMRISVSDVERDPKLRASIAGAFLELVVTMDEIADIPPVATADTIDVDVGPLDVEAP